VAVTRCEATQIESWRGELTDEQLVERALAGSEEGFRGLVERYQRAVYNLLVRTVRNPSVAEELAQETFLRAFSHLRTYDPAFKFGSWLLRIARNLAIDAYRRRSIREVSADETGDESDRGKIEAFVDPAADTARGAEHGQLARAIEAALDTLRPEYRQLVILRYQEELSYEEIGGIMGLPIGTVKSYLHRARAEMARHLQPFKAAGRRT
jgi:RNA polymerase sigma-70 factor (ECF subfamily)